MRDVPLSFVENRGQWDDAIRFVAMKGSSTTSLEQDRIVLDLNKGPENEGDHYRIILRLRDASPDTVLNGEEPSRSRFNFFLGDESRWQRQVPGYARVRYAGLQEGVDLVVQEGASGLRYDLELSPGADLAEVEMQVEGLDTLRVDDSGCLVMETGGTSIPQSPPIAWQTGADGTRYSVECAFRILGPRSYGFEVPGRDPKLALTIDPTVEYATYFFSSLGMAVDAQGCAYFVGHVLGSSLPLPPDLVDTDLGNDTSAAGGSLCYLAKLDPGALSDGDPATPDSLLFLTVFGGSDGDTAFDVALGPADSAVFIVGTTSSPDFPTTNSRPLNGSKNGFLVVLDAVTGSTLVTSTLIGGPDTTGHNLVVDDEGYTYLSGEHSADGTGSFPDSPYQQVHGGLGDGDVYLAVVDPLGQVVGSALIGGEFGDGEHALARDGQGNVYIVGYSSQANHGNFFPTTEGAFQSIPGGGKGKSKTETDAFLVRLSPMLSLDYSTLLGGKLREDFVGAGQGVALDGSGRVCIVGRTTSSDYPITANAFDPNPGTGQKAFITELDFSGVPDANPTMTFSSYFGGTATAGLGNVLYDPAGNLFVRGTAMDSGGGGGRGGRNGGGGSEFPLVGDQLKTTPLDRDSFLSVFQPNGNGFDLVYSTLIGGEGFDGTYNMVLHSDGTVYMSGLSENLPTTGNAVFATNADVPGSSGSWEGYILKISSPIEN